MKKCLCCGKLIMNSVELCECGYSFGSVKPVSYEEFKPPAERSLKYMIKRYFSRFSISGVVLMVAFGWASYFLSLWVGFLVYLFVNGGLNWQGGSRVDMNSIMAVCVSVPVILFIIYTSVSIGLVMRIPDKEYRSGSLKKFPLKTILVSAGLAFGAAASYAICGYLFKAGYFAPRPSEGDFMFISFAISITAGVIARILFFVRTGF